MKHIFFAVLTAACILAPVSALATVRTVDSGGLGDFTTIQAAVDASVATDEVHVGSGTYSENVVMKTGVSLLGGYLATNWAAAPDPVSNLTVIDAGGTGSAVTAAGSATLDGFTLTGSASTGVVAGVYVYACSPTITNNVIKLNGRHGIYVEGNASPYIHNNLITSNGYYGIYLYSFGNGGTPNIHNNTLDSNKDGVHTYSFSPSIKNNIVSSSTNYGIYVGVFSNVTCDYNDVWNSGVANYNGISAGPHDKGVDPLYSGALFHLQETPSVSPCVDAGTDVGLAYLGLPDMGYFEASVTQPNPWPPEGLVASPLATKVFLDWTPNIETNIAGYKVSYGTAPGSYTATIDVGNVTEYTVDSLINEAAYFFAVKAYNTLTNESGYSDEVTATPTAGVSELPHYDWDASFGGGDCTMCHQTQSGGNLLPAGFDYRYSTELCVSCHNLTGSARGKLVSLADSHPVFVNVTTGGNVAPTYGNITGMASNMMADHLDGGKLVCNTCHNVMEKTEDPGRTWEMTSFAQVDAWLTFDLQKGGWSYYDYMRPDIYSSPTLLSAPTYVRERGQYRLDNPLQDYYPGAGRIKFKEPYFDYAYVTLYYPYLRVNNSGNVMCLDCHNTATHEMLNCMTCHDNHNYANRLGIKALIKTPNSGIKPVVFSDVTGANSFADGDNVYDGICEVCHTQTLYHRNNGSVLNNHTGTGLDYSGTNCVTCHTHVGGFYP